MTTDKKTKDKKLKFDINKETAKILALSSGKIVLLLQNWGETSGWYILTLDIFTRISRA